MAAASAAVSAVAGTGAAVIEAAVGVCGCKGSLHENAARTCYPYHRRWKGQRGPNFVLCSEARLPDISTSAALAEVAFPKREEEGEAEVDQELVQEVKEKEDKEEKGSDGLQEASFSPALKSTATSGLPRDAGDKEELVRDASICKPPSPEREGLTRLTAKDETAESVVFSPGTADGQENVDEVAPEESQDVVRLPAAAPLVEPSSLAECDEPVGNTEDTATSSDEALELRLAPATPCSQEDRRHPASRSCL